MCVLLNQYNVAMGMADLTQGLWSAKLQSSIMRTHQHPKCSWKQLLDGDKALYISFVISCEKLNHSFIYVNYYQGEVSKAEQIVKYFISLWPFMHLWQPETR